MKRIAIFAVSVLVLSAVQAKHLSESEARTTYESCIEKSIAQLDDKVSDAEQIAIAAQYVCDKEYRHYLSSMLKTSEALDVFDSRFDREMLAPLIVDVLRNRASRR